VRLSERMGTGPGPAIAAPGGNPFLATPSWEAASAAAAADERPDSGVQPSRWALRQHMELAGRTAYQIVIRTAYQIVVEGFHPD